MQSSAYTAASSIPEGSATRQRPWSSATPLTAETKAGAVAVGSAAGNGNEAITVESSDIVVAQISCVHRLPLIREAGPRWRKGVRTFVTLNNSELAESLNKGGQDADTTYAFYPDEEGPLGTWRGAMPGDTRLAVTPFLAHQHFGDTYKWMLFGDDDTIFYMHGVQQLLKRFDPELPLMISDNWWVHGRHPDPEAPRCLPCSFDPSAIKPNTFSYNPRPACPFCTRGLAWGTYDPTRYNCTDAHMDFMRQRLDPRVWQDPAQAAGQFVGAGAASAQAAGQSAGAGAASAAGQFVGAMRELVANNSAFMEMHAQLAAKRGATRRLDWEMRLAGRSKQHRNAQRITRLDPKLQAGLDALGVKGLEEVQRRFPFCAKHDDRLHDNAADGFPGGAYYHGGAGVVMSVGLMRMLDPQKVIDHILCCNGKRSTGGDAMLAHAVGQLHGIGITDPGTAILAGDLDYKKYVHFIDSNDPNHHKLKEVLRDQAEFLVDVNKPAVKARHAAWLTENAVSTHVRARFQENSTSVQEVVSNMLAHIDSHQQALGWILEARATVGPPLPGAPNSPEVLEQTDIIIGKLRRRHGRRL